MNIIIYLILTIENRKFYRVLTDIPLDKALIYYSLNDILPCELVLVQVQSRKVYGIIEKIITLDDLKNEGIKIEKIREILGNFGVVCDEKFIKFIYQFAWYNMQKLGDVVSAMISSLAILSEQSRAKVGKIKEIKKQEIILSEKQIEISTKIQEKINQFSVSLIEGVTGSGKTAIFLNIIENLINNNENAQILICIPEISLTSHTKSFFENILGFEPIIWHSSVSKAKKKQCLRDIINGNARVVIGTRSSILLSFKNLKLIVIDEEHDSSYKQNENLIYSARDMAIMRAKILDISVILSSATPSIETFYNAINGKYDRFCIEHRFSKVQMPEIKIIDMNNKELRAKSGKCISSQVVEIAKKCIDSGQQVLFFLNRRGFSTSVLCGSCRNFINCPNCSVNMAFHQSSNMLICHYCGHSGRIETDCKHCGELDKWVKIGFGVEKVSEELKLLFPDVNQQIFSSDTVNKSNIDEVLEQITSGETQIIIGTQMISKGYNFPKLKCVVIVDTDTGFLDGDFRIYEKTYQTVMQVAGRAGRFDERGLILIQTYQVQNPAILSVANANQNEFYTSELIRRDGKYSKLPPFMRQIAIIVSSDDDSIAKESINIIAMNLQKDLGGIAKIFGPAPSLVKRINKQYRYRLIVVTNRDKSAIDKIRYRVLSIEIKNKVLTKIDVDPLNFI